MSFLALEFALYCLDSSSLNFILSLECCTSCKNEKKKMDGGKKWRIDKENYFQGNDDWDKYYVKNGSFDEMRWD